MKPDPITTSLNRLATQRREILQAFDQLPQDVIEAAPAILAQLLIDLRRINTETRGLMRQMRGEAA